MKNKKSIFIGYRIVLCLTFLNIYPTYAVLNNTEPQLLQQQSKLSGIIKDSQGPLAGVIVKIKDTNSGTITDMQGRYSLNVNKGDTIVFSMIGYKEKAVQYQGEPIINITMLEDSSSLDEIVVNAGYYSVKDRERTGSIARVTAKDIELQPVISPLQAIQGRMAGVNITQYSGVPGSGFDIQIRGRNSLRTIQNSIIDGNTPLYIIDGVPISTNITDSGMSTPILYRAHNNPLSSINPSDVESIEILKDADATAIYGSRGANGVVLITTKKGKQGNTKFTISTSTSLSKVASKMNLMNTNQYLQMRELAFLNDQITNYPSNTYDLNGAWDKYRYTDWQKELIGGTAINQNIQLGISGGNENTNFLVSTNHNEQTTVFPTSKGYKRNTILLSFGHTSMNKKFTINNSTTYSVQKNNLIATDLTKKALTLAPNAPSLYKPDGSLNWQNGTFDNPLASQNATYNYENKAFILNTTISYKIIDNLDFKLNSGITSNNFEETLLTPHTIYDPAKGYNSEFSRSELGITSNFSFLLEPQLSYDAVFLNQHRFSAIIGMTYENTENNSLRLSGSNFSSNALISNISAAKVKNVQQTGNNQYKYLAFFSRFNYIYKDTYILNLTARRDGSSRFGDNNRFANFWAIGTAWIFSNESFLKDSKWLNLGKFRTSYGITGSDNIGDYQYLDTYNISAYSYDQISGLMPSRLYNPNFSWETTKKLELSLELSLLNNRVNTTFSWYKNKSSNQLVGIPLPNTTGFSSIQDNLNATVQNKGWEITLNTLNIQNNNWNWTTTFNISFPNNKLLEFPNLESSTFARNYIVGKSLNIKKLYHYEGIDSNTGLYQFTDYNQDGKISALDDKQSIKDLSIKYHGGLQNTLTYKNFSLDFLFQFVKQTNYNYNSQLVLPGALWNQPVEVLDAWTATNPNASYSFYGTGKNAEAYGLTKLIPESDKAVSDASFIRLKNISISYTFKIPKTKIDNIQVYFQGQNLLTLTKYFGLDPEFITLTSNLPPLKTYAFGVRLIL